MIDIHQVLHKYQLDQIHIGALGGHSALDICHGAKQQGLKTVVVCQKGREKTYSKYYKTNGKLGIIDEIILVDKFSDVSSPKVVHKLQELNTIFIQSRYFWVYCDYQKIEHDFNVPIFGHRGIVRTEERTEPNNQYELMKKAGLKYPTIFHSPSQIDRLVLVKVPEAQRSYERAFFLASSKLEYYKKADELIAKKTITTAGLKSAIIEEFIVGAQVNFNFFYSKLNYRLELMGTDMRRQTNLDGLLRLPALEQTKALKMLKVKYVETGHVAVTVKESLLEKAFEAAENLIEVTKEDYPPGLFGPFGLQTAITPGPPKEELVTFDLSLRMPGSPGITATPYSAYLFRKPISMGERIAMEIKQGIKSNRLNNILT